MSISRDRQLGRAKNAVLGFLEQKLSVPKIYIDADWNGQRVDVLALDRDGVGDVHIALLFPWEHLEETGHPDPRNIAELETLLAQFGDSLPAHYKYIGVVDINESDWQSGPLRLPSNILEISLAPDGIGRVGFLRIDGPSEREPQVDMVIKPERFRAAVARIADDYVQQHSADWEIRA